MFKKNYFLFTLITLFSSSICYASEDDKPIASNTSQKKDAWYVAAKIDTRDMSIEEIEELGPLWFNSYRLSQSWEDFKAKWIAGEQRNQQPATTQTTPLMPTKKADTSNNKIDIRNMGTAEREQWAIWNKHKNTQGTWEDYRAKWIALQKQQQPGANRRNTTYTQVYEEEFEEDSQAAYCCCLSWKK